METHYYLRVFRDDGAMWDDATGHSDLESAEEAGRGELANGAREVHVLNASLEIVKRLSAEPLLGIQ